MAKYVVDLCMLCCFCKISSCYFVDKAVSNYSADTLI